MGRDPPRGHPGQSEPSASTSAPGLGDSLQTPLSQDLWVDVTATLQGRGGVMQALPWGPGWASGRDAPQQRHQGSQGPRLCLRHSQPMLIRFNSEFPTQRVPAEGGCRWPPPGWWLAAHSPCNAPTSACQVSSPGPAPDRLLQPSGGLYRGRGCRGHSLLAGAAERPAQSRELLLTAPQRRSTLGESQARGRPRDGPRKSPILTPSGAGCAAHHPSENARLGRSRAGPPAGPERLIS